MTFQRFRTWSLAALVAAATFAAQATPLPALVVDKSQITVSGLSSGGFMANQLGYAYSSTFKGIGVFAGGPYMSMVNFTTRPPRRASRSCR